MLLDAELLASLGLANPLMIAVRSLKLALLPWVWVFLATGAEDHKA